MASNIPVIVQGNSFSLAIPLQIYVIDDDEMVLQDYTPDPTDQVSIQLKGSRRNYTYTPTINGNVANIDLGGYELADNYGVVVSVVKANGQRLRSFRTDQFFIVESSDDLTQDDIIQGLEENVIYLNTQIFVAGKDGRGIVSITKTSTSGLVDTYTILYTDATTSTFNVTNGSGGVVDNLTTGGSAFSLSAEQGKVLYQLVKTSAQDITLADFISGKWYNNSNYNIGDTMPEQPTNTTAGLYCIRIPVIGGTAMRINTKGSTNAYAWTLLDTDNKILSTSGSDADYTTNPATITASQDGYLIVQHNNNQHPVAQDTIMLSVYDVVKRLQAEVSDLDDRVAVIEGKVADPETETYTTIDYHIEDGTDNCYWQTNTIGATITTATKIAVQGVVFRCLEPIQVYAGDRIQVKVLGGGNGRAWALTDTNRKILSNAEASADGRVTPLETTATQDGWLYVSLNGSNGLPESGSTLAVVKRGTFALYDETYTKDEVDAMVGKRKMRILSVGNSYSMDALSYLPEIAKLYSPNVEVTIGILYYAGATIGEHYAGLTYELLLYKNGIWTSQASKTLEYAIGIEEWDLVTLHQASQYSDNYASRYFIGRTSTAGQDDLLQGLIDKIKGYGYSGQFGWLMTPAYPAGNTSDLGNTQDAMMDGIIDFAENVMANYTDMKVLLPCGDALMRARKSTQFEGITNEFFYTDNLHLNRGIGAYIEACAAYEALLGFNGGCQLQVNLAWAKEAYAHGTETGMTLNNESGAISVAMDAVLEPYSYIYGTAVIEVAGATPTQTLATNTYYKFTGAVTSLTLTLGTAISGITNIYAFSFVAGQADPVISLPASVTIDGTPSIAQGDYVEFSIMNNIAIFKVVTI